MFKTLAAETPKWVSLNSIEMAIFFTLLKIPMVFYYMPWKSNEIRIFLVMFSDFQVKNQLINMVIPKTNPSPVEL